MRRTGVGLSVIFWVAASVSAAGAQAVVEVSPGSDEGRVISLEEAVELALEHNLNLQSSVDTVATAQVSEGLAASRFGLKLTPSFAQGFGSGSSGDQRYGIEASKLLPFGTQVSFGAQSDIRRTSLDDLAASSLRLTITQPLLRGFGPKSTRFDLTNARRGVESADRSLELSRQRLAVDVVASYYNIVRQQGLVDVAEKSVERTKELLRASEARLKVGLASKLDVFRAELQISRAEESLIIREEALELAMDTFKFNLGLSPDETIYLEKVEPEFQPVALDLEEQTRLALANRIEVLEERDRIGDARRSLSIAKQNLLPQLDLNVRYEQVGLGTSFTDSFDFDDRGVSFFLSTSYPLDRAAEAASVALSQIDMEARHRSLRLLEYNITNEVRAAVRNIGRLGKSILLQERNMDFAEKQHRLAALRYQRGLASNFDIIDAENNLIAARSNYVSLLADYHVALIELKRVTGTLDLSSEFTSGGLLPAARHHP